MNSNVNTFPYNYTVNVKNVKNTFYLGDCKKIIIYSKNRSKVAQNRRLNTVKNVQNAMNYAHNEKYIK